MKSGMTRREMLGSLGFMAFAGRMGFAPGVAKAAEGKKPGIALQLYTMRDPAKKDLADTLKKCADMGWKYVQWSGLPKLSAEEMRAALDKAGLKCIACHCGMEAFEKDFDAEVKFWKTVGNKDVAPGGMMGDCKANLEAWLKGAARLEAIATRLQGVDMRLSYHNHAWELDKFPGDDRPKLDILMESAKNLNAEFDIAWVAIGKADPAAYMRKYKHRCPVIHAKDYVMPDGKKQKFVPLGQGLIKWDEIFAAGREAGVEWYVYEQDSGEGSPFDYCKASYDFLSRQSL